MRDDVNSLVIDVHIKAAEITFSTKHLTRPMLQYCESVRIYILTVLYIQSNLEAGGLGLQRGPLLPAKNCLAETGQMKVGKADRPVCFDVQMAGSDWHRQHDSMKPAWLRLQLRMSPAMVY